MRAPGETFRSRISDALRKGHYKSAREMAEDIGIREETLSRWLNKPDPPNPSLENLQTIAAKLGYTLPELISDPGGKAPEPRVIYVREPGVLDEDDAEELRRLLATAAGRLRGRRGPREKP